MNDIQKQNEPQLPWVLWFLAATQKHKSGKCLLSCRGVATQQVAIEQHTEAVKFLGIIFYVEFMYGK